MITKFSLKNIAEDMAKKFGTNLQLDDKFKQEYLLYNVEENDLLEYGFVYVGTSDYLKCNIYRKENIEATFIEDVLHIYEIPV